jgi:hypothetical protein
MDEDSILMKPSWMEDEVYNALMDFNSLEWIEEKEKKLETMLTIYQNQYLLDCICEEDSLESPKMSAENHPLSDDLYDFNGKLISELYKDYHKVYYNMGSEFLKSKGMLKDTVQLYLHEIPQYMLLAGEEALNYLYVKVLYYYKETTFECIDTYVRYYSKIKELQEERKTQLYK